MRLIPVTAANESESSKAVVRNFTYLAVGSILTQALTFLLAAYSARVLGPSTYGSLNFVRIFVSYFALPANLGLTTLAIRRLSSEMDADVINQTATLRWWLTVCGAIALGASALLIARSPDEVWLLVVFGCEMLISGLCLDWVFVAGQNVRPIAVARVAGTLVYCVLAAVALYLTRSVVLLAALSVVPVLAMTGVSWAQLNVVGAVRPLLAYRDGKALWALVLAALPFGMSIVMIQVYYNLDVVMLGYMASRSAVGQYSAAYKIVTFVSGFAGLFVSAALPLFAKRFQSDPSDIPRLAGGNFTLAGVVALPIGVGGSMLASSIMSTAFGASYAEGGTAFGVLIWSSVIIWLSVNFGNTLLACGFERKYLVGVTLGAVVNVAVNLYAIPRWGTVGAAGATVAAEGLVMLWMGFVFVRELGVPLIDWWRFVRAGIACVPMAVWLQVSDQWSVFASVLGGGVVYLGAAIVLRVVSRSDAEYLVAAMRRNDPARDSVVESLSQSE